MKWLRRRKQKKRVARTLDTSFSVAEGAVDAIWLVAEIVAAVANDH